MKLSLAIVTFLWHTLCSLTGALGSQSPLPGELGQMPSCAVSIQVSVLWVDSTTGVLTGQISPGYR